MCRHRRVVAHDRISRFIAPCGGKHGAIQTHRVAGNHQPKRQQRITGLSEDFLERANLRVSPDRFYKELLRDRGLTVGRLDARYTGKDYDNAGEGPDNDPSFYGIDAAYPAAIEQTIDTLREGIADGRTESAVPIRKEIEQIERMVALPSEALTVLRAN